MLGRQPIRVTLEDIEIVLVVEDRAVWSQAKVSLIVYVHLI